MVKSGYRDVLKTFIKSLSSDTSLLEIQRADLVNFLAKYSETPWRKHSFYRAFRTFFKWQSITYDIPNPFWDRFGNTVIQAPRTPDKVLYTITPSDVRLLIEAASESRNKAIISLVRRLRC